MKAAITLLLFLGATVCFGQNTLEFSIDAVSGDPTHYTIETEYDFDGHELTIYNNEGKTLKSVRLPFSNKIEVPFNFEQKGEYILQLSKGGKIRRRRLFRL